MIVVAGATGSLGSRIVEGLRERRENVRALVRPTSNHSALQQAGVPVIYGDLTQPATLERALAGARVVITTATTSKKNDDTIENVDVAGNQNLIEAARKAGVEHFVFISTVGATPDHPVP
ncbi:MAG: NAD(P)H-binding protein, partial [Candidatus Cloacimonetes bacterium]|nr:NAD(P)H-binding protein [Candidatus Cloacimonadota bacterium]